jgi:hypothetical protein
MNKQYVFIKTTGQIGKVIGSRASGYQINQIGIVPRDECREATKEEIQKWLNR